MRLKKIIIIIISMILAYIIGFHIIPRDCNRSSQTRFALKFIEDIEINKKIERKNIELVEIGKYNFPNNVLYDENEVIGKYTATDIKKNQFVMDTLINDRIPPNDTFRYGDPIYDAIAINTDIAKCVGGLPKVGDRVRVLIYIPSKELNSIGHVMIDEDLDDVEVIDLLNHDGISILEVKSNAISGGYAQTKVPSIVVLKANYTQQKKLIQGMYEGELHLALRPKIYKSSLEAKKSGTNNILDKAIDKAINIDAAMDVKATNLSSDKEMGGFVIDD